MKRPWQHTVAPFICKILMPHFIVRQSVASRMNEGVVEGVACASSCVAVNDAHAC